MPLHISARLQSQVMSIVVTRLIRPPSVSLTSRDVPEAETVFVPTRHGNVRCLITRPAAQAPLAAAGALAPVTVNFHGGGFVIGNPLQDDHLARGIAGEVGSVVVNVDYTTSPRARFPQALEECFDVVAWVARTGRENTWDDDRIALSGGSAGANLALGVLTLAGRVNGPVIRAAELIVPAVDLTIPPELHTSPIKKPFVDAGMRTMVDVSYFAKGTDKTDPLVSPAYLEEEFAGFPPLLIVTAENDTFRPFIDRFAIRAKQIGVSVRELLMEGVDHDFYFARTTPKPVLETLMTNIRQHLLDHLA